MGDRTAGPHLSVELVGVLSTRLGRMEFSDLLLNGHHDLLNPVSQINLTTLGPQPNKARSDVQPRVASLAKDTS